MEPLTGFQSWCMCRSEPNEAVPTGPALCLCHCDYNIFISVVLLSCMTILQIHTNLSNSILFCHC